jgi:hypothetical protein
MNSTLKGLGLLEVLVSLWTASAFADLEVRRVLVLQRSPIDASVRFIAVSSPEDGTSMQLWRGDYLWSICRTVEFSHPVRTVQCGEHLLEWNTTRESVNWSETSWTSQNG